MGIMCGIINIMCYFNDLRHDVGGPAREISRVAQGVYGKTQFPI